MKWRTPIESVTYPFNLDLDSRILFLGSCFTENIGNKMNQLKFDCHINPVGISFNPISLENQMNYALGKTELNESQVVSNQEKFVHFDFHGSMGHHTPEKCLEQIKHGLSLLQTAIISSNAIFISLGSAIVYTLKPNGLVVANCHKFPTDNFDKRQLEIHEIHASLTGISSLVQSLNPDCHIIFTVSPVRHARHGLVANSQSKASLISAVHMLLSSEKNVHYFPSFEILVDDLRDYRFFADDLVHPSQQAIEYIWSYLKTHLLTEEAFEDLKSLQSLTSSINHKLMTTDPKINETYLTDLLTKINHHKYASRFEGEKSNIEDQLKSIQRSNT